VPLPVARERTGFQSQKWYSGGGVVPFGLGNLRREVRACDLLSLTRSWGGARLLFLGVKKMKSLFVALCVVFLAIPSVVASDGNPNPHLYLEIFADDAHCVSVGIPPVCFYDGYKAEWVPCYVFLRVSKAANGFYGLPFGMTAQNTSVFLGSIACPGFLKGPSTAGEPAAIMVTSSEECHQWQHHPIYCTWQAKDSATDYFDIVASADVGHHNVINCDNQYDTGTVIGGRAQWIGPQTIICGGDIYPVEPATWGKIKASYR
jgi:hypothetical protein